MSYLIDTHCHLDVKHSPEELPELVSRAMEANVEKMVWVGIERQGTERALKAANEYESIFVSAGVHPHDSTKWSPEVDERYREISSHPKVVAIGETGLDFFRDYSPVEAQYKSFHAQCELACDVDLPIVLHSRDAAEETWGVIEGYLDKGIRGTFHCFVYDYEFAKRAIDNGFYVSVNGILTYPKSSELRDTISKLPLNKILLETDCPFLLPQKFRRKINEPAYMVESFIKLAEIIGADQDELRETLRVNSENCFPKLAGNGA